MKWTKEEIELLKNIFENDTNENVAKILNKTTKQVERKATSLKLKKSKEHKSNMISNRNKMFGRDLSYENLKNIALKYKTRGQFQRLDSSAYTTARRKGYLDDICSHMIKTSYSIPQLILFYIIKQLLPKDKIEYNTRKIITPYEIDIFVKKYNIGFEYDGKGWHNNPEIDLIKDNLCLDKNITLIRIIENNRNYESDIKNQLINNLNLINKTCDKKFTTSDIQKIPSGDINNFVNDNIIDDKQIKKIVRKYTDYKEFRTNEQSLYWKLLKLKLIDKYTSNLTRHIKHWTKKEAINEIKKYQTLKEFIEKSNSCYSYLRANSLEYLFDKLRTQNNFNIEDIKNEIKKYTYLKDFREKSPNHYVYIKTHKLFNLIEDLKRTPHRKKEIDICDIEKVLPKYEYLLDFKKEHLKYYKFIIKYKLSYLIEDLKRRKPQFSLPEIESVIKNCGSLKEFRISHLKMYKFIIKRKLNYLLLPLK